MEPGPSNPPNAASRLFDFTNVPEPSKMRLHGGNIPTIPQDKLCPHCPAKFTRWAIFRTCTPVLSIIGLTVNRPGQSVDRGTHLNRHLKTRKYSEPLDLCGV